MNTPPAMPTVTFDARLGASLDHIDFDFNRFYQLASEFGATDAQINDLNVHYSGRESRPLLEVSEPVGTYSTRRTRVTVFVARILSEEMDDIPADSPFKSSVAYGVAAQKAAAETDTTSRHEVGHWLAHLHNSAGHRSLLKNRRRAAIAAGLFAAASVAMPVATSEAATAAVPAGALVIYGFFKSLISTETKRGAKKRRSLLHEDEAYGFEKNTEDYTVVRLSARLPEAAN